MGKRLRILFLSSFIICFAIGKGQVNSMEIDAEKEKKFKPYMVYRHGGAEGLAELKKNKPHEYLKELWYYSESFYVKRDHFEKGLRFDESFIDVGRYEHLRKENEETIITFFNYKDVVVLLPANKLQFKPTDK